MNIEKHETLNQTLAHENTSDLEANMEETNNTRKTICVQCVDYETISGSLYKEVDTNRHFVFNGLDWYYCGSFSHVGALQYDPEPHFLVSKSVLFQVNGRA